VFRRAAAFGRLRSGSEVARQGAFGREEESLVADAECPVQGGVSAASADFTRSKEAPAEAGV
jgi:hypothetical protein